MAGTRFFQHALEGGVVVVAEEDLPPRVGAVEDVVDQSAGSHTRSTRHGGEV